MTRKTAAVATPSPLTRNEDIAVLSFIGPSGAGKSALVRELDKGGAIALNPSWTDRPRRMDELDGSAEHTFVTGEEFSELERSGFFLEVVQPFGLPYRYGLPRLIRSERVPAIIVRAPMLKLVDKHFPRHRVYQVECRLNSARKRLLDRGEKESRLGTRLEGFDAEAELGRNLADRVFYNEGTLEELVLQVTAAIREDFP